MIERRNVDVKEVDYENIDRPEQGLRCTFSLTSKDTLCRLLRTSLDRVLLSGSAELTNSKFRNCPAVRGRRRRLPIWAWVLIAVGGAILALILFGTIIAVVRKSKKNGTSKKKAFPEQRKPGDKSKDLY